MNRFFVKPDEILNGIVDIQGEDAIHILRVLRLKEGDLVEICDGAGNDYKGTIIKRGKDRVRFFLKDARPTRGEPGTRVILYQGIPKGNKMDVIIQKCVELGIHSIVPVVTARTVTDLSRSEKAEKKVARWQRIAEEAAKQSRRGIIPHVQLPVAYNEAVEKASASFKILPWEEERCTGLREALQGADGTKDIAILIGPEGGFEEAEVDKAKERGWNIVTLGPRILRTETAGMVVLSAIMFSMEEMG